MPKRSKKQKNHIKNLRKNIIEKKSLNLYISEDFSKKSSKMDEKNNLLNNNLLNNSGF
jgi:hypothetical protein